MQQKKTILQTLIITLVLILTLPVFYLLATRVLLPMSWNEQAVQNNNELTSEEQKP